MTVLIAVLSVVGGGIAGALLAFGLSFRREQRRVQDAYRAPQRAAIAAVVAGTNDLLLRVFEFRTFIENCVAQDEAARKSVGAVRSTYTDSEADLISGQVNRAVIGIDEAFSLGKLTVVDGLTYEAMATAYKEFEKLQLSYLDLESPPRTPNTLRAAVRPVVDHTVQLKANIRGLVDIGQKQLAPPQSSREERELRAAKVRLKQKYPEIRS